MAEASDLQLRAALHFAWEHEIQRRVRLQKGEGQGEVFWTNGKAHGRQEHAWQCNRFTEPSEFLSICVHLCIIGL